MYVAKLISSIFLISFKLLIAQSLSVSQLSSSAESYSGNNLNVFYILGDISLDKESNSDFELHDGIVGGISDIRITSINESFTDLLNIEVYPIPTSSRFTIKRQENLNEHLQFYVTSIEGSTLLQGSIYANEIKKEIDIKHLPSAIYFLSIINKNGSSKEYFKIIKN